MNVSLISVFNISGNFNSKLDYSKIFMTVDFGARR